jgi:cellulose synthase/poly-beta-1,6-N-acetylglucosamine synthase-like glycosyltransferase
MADPLVLVASLTLICITYLPMTFAYILNLRKGVDLLLVLQLLTALFINLCIFNSIALPLPLKKSLLLQAKEEYSLLPRPLP